MNPQASSSASGPLPGIVCLAHLGWDFVWQRPQQILARIAAHMPVLYINEMQVRSTASNQPELLPVGHVQQLSAYQPVTPAAGTAQQRQALYFAMVEQQLIDAGWATRTSAGLVATRPLILWFYTPAPVDIIARLPASLIVYDVMDELANFRYAASELPQQEDQLLAQADIVFTGGRSIYNARKARHHNIHLFASGVDPQHFAQALHPNTPAAAEISACDGPVFGYYGVIDERIDLALLDTIAAEQPDATIVMVGPTAKISSADLPQRANIIWTGLRPYAELPRYLKRFDICLMPFALNDATRSISPTKALEYMAAHKPIISTAVPDVVANWSDIIWIASDQHDFSRKISAVLAETSAARQQRHARERQIVARNTWEHIASAMQSLITDPLAQPQTLSLAQPSHTSAKEPA